MSSVYRIGDLVLDAGRQELTRDGQRIHLGPLSYRFLLALVETAPAVASHDALAAAVWRGRVVSPEAISQRGKLLREALGDDPHHPRYVEVLRGRGYRLVPPVVPLPAEKPPARLRPPAIALAALLMLGIAAVPWLLATREPEPGATPSIAVLPFADMSPGHDQEYFAEGMAEEILNVLSETTSLRVTARTSSFSFRNTHADIATIAKKLGVSHLLEGSVRRSGSRVRITVQLVAAEDGTHVWSESYDRELRDVLRLQHDIAASVAAALEANLLRPGAAAPATVTRVNPEAFEAYLRGRQRMQIVAKEPLADAERYFRHAIEIDPAFVSAYSSLGLVYTLQILDVREGIAENTEKLRNVVRQGLDIAPEHPGLIALSGQLARYDGDMRLAERRFRRAFELDRADIPVVMLYATFRLDQGRPREALRIARRLLDRDPLNPLLHITAIACHIDMGNLAGAIAAAKHYDDAVATFSAPGYWLSGYARMMLAGDMARGIRSVATAVDYDTGGATRPYAYPYLYYSIGDIETGDAALKTYSRLGNNSWIRFEHAYRRLVTGEVGKARQMAVEALSDRGDYSAWFSDIMLAYLATDALIAGGEAGRAVELIETLAPVYRSYRATPHIPPEEFSPAPYTVKAVFTTYPALYFPVYIRALRAAGDAAGAERMLEHLEAVQRLRRERGLFTAEWRIAEARALRGDAEGALDALEQAERSGTIYLAWQLFLLHNEIFAGLRRDPRFHALVARIEAEMARQRAELARSAQARH